MYLTRLALDIKKNETMRALNIPRRFHGAIEKAFDGATQRKLWRLDKIGRHYYLLLLSDEMPNLDHAVEQFGIEKSDKGYETKAYDPFLSHIEVGKRYRFRLTANPTNSAPSKKADTNQPGKRQRGKVHAHITVEHQKRWLMNRAEKHGFSLSEDQFDVVHHQWIRFNKEGNQNRRVSILSVSFEGELEVTDAEAFRTLLVEGIGRGKAYGQGLMTVIPIKER